MSSYPATVATFREKTNLPGVTFVDPDKATIYAEDLTQIEGEIVAIETVLGTSPEGTAATVSERIADTESALDTKQPSLGFVPEDVTNKDTTATLGTSDTKYPSQKAVKTYIDTQITAVKSALFPVGSIYTNATNSTNPATLLGFGTWVVFGAGRVLVSKAASGTFATAGATGGEETHTLTVAEMPSHRHGMYEATGNVETATGDAQGSRILNYNPNYRYTTYEGSGNAHNNLQPYVVVYMWQRTA